MPQFSVTRGTAKAIELLNEALYSKLFVNSANIPNEDILMPYQIYFQLIRHPISLIKDSTIFWEKCCYFFLNETNSKPGLFVFYLRRLFE